MASFACTGSAALGSSAQGVVTKRRRQSSNVMDRSLPGRTRVDPAKSSPFLSSPVVRANNGDRVRSRKSGRSTLQVCNSAAAADFPVPAEQEEPTISEFDAAANVAKAVMGAGCFSLPYAFATGGLVLSTITMALGSLLCLYTISMMCRAEDKIVKSKSPEEAKEILRSYTKIIATSVGPKGGKVAEVLLLMCCLGVCSAYMVFIAGTVETVLVPPVVTSPALTSLTQNQLILPLLVLMIPLTFISLAGLSFISVMGNVSVVAGMSFVAYYALSLPANPAIAAPLFNIGAFSDFFGPIAFLFFVHFTFPSISSSMTDRTKFLSAAKKGFAFATVVCALFGIVGAIGFGTIVNSNVIAMLQGAVLVTGVKLLLCVNLLFTFPIIATGAFVVIEGYFKDAGIKVSSLGSKAIRAAFVIMAATCAVSIPSFGKLIGYVGGVACTVCTLVFPPLMLLKSADKGELAKWEWISAKLIILLGLALVAFTLFG